MSKHKHEWLEQMYVFPNDVEDEGTYEHDEPYLVQYCADRECGQRRTVVLNLEEAVKVKQREGFE